MKKIFFILLVFLIFLTNVNAIVVQDIQQQIQTGNQDILRSNAEMTGQITALKTEVQNLTLEVQDLKANSVMKSDLPEVYGTIQQLNRDANGQMLATMLAVMVCGFAVLFLAKGKGWL